MPNRVLREGILDSDRMTALVKAEGWPAECFYRRLHSVADDFGCFDARPSVMRANCYPTLLELVREADVQRWIAACVKSGLVRLYTVDGRNYGVVLDFKQFTRITKRKFPPPPEELQCECNADATHLRSYSASDSVSDSDSWKGGPGENPPDDGDLPYTFDAAELPDALKATEFVSVWPLWVAHRGRKSSTRLNRRSARMQLKKLAEMGVARAVAAIEHSIAGSYQGIFEPKAIATKPRSTGVNADVISKIAERRNK